MLHSCARESRQQTHLLYVPVLVLVKHEKTDYGVGGGVGDKSKQKQTVGFRDLSSAGAAFCSLRGKHTRESTQTRTHTLQPSPSSVNHHAHRKMSLLENMQYVVTHSTHSEKDSCRRCFVSDSDSKGLQAQARGLEYRGVWGWGARGYGSGMRGGTVVGCKRERWWDARGSGGGMQVSRDPARTHEVKQGVQEQIGLLPNHCVQLSSVDGPTSTAGTAGSTNHSSRHQSSTALCVRCCCG